MPNSKPGATPNIALYNLRDSRAETQDDVAEALNRLADARGVKTAITGNHVSRWERGVVHPSRLHCQLLAAHFGVTVAELGLTRQRSVPAGHPGRVLGAPDNVLSIDDTAMEEDPRVEESQREWLHTRRRLNAHHLPLAQSAAHLYPEEYRIGETGVLSRPDWMHSPMLDLRDIELVYEPDAPPPEVDGTEEFTSHLRPLRAPGQRYQRYSHAIRDVARPKLLENRYSWRLLEAAFSDGKGRLRFGDMNYFDAMDTCEAIAHETSSVLLVNDGQVAPATWRGMRFRKAIGDPFDLARRAMLLSINTLTIRKDGSSASMILHKRSAANVATSGGVIGVMPAGVFQPSTVRTRDHSNDFDLWRNIMREYSEEFLGNPEHSGDGPGADYTQEPMRSLDKARDEGGIRVFFLGIGVGALDLWGAIETVAVFDAEVFDEIFTDIVHINDEGSVLRVGSALPTVHIPFTKQVIDDLWATGRLATETALTLRAAWSNREQLLGR